MECSEPGMMREEELIAYLEGEKVRLAVIQHLARCQHCSSQLTAYRRMQSVLARKLYRWDCPSNQVLGEYHLGLLDGQQATEVRQHLLACVLCSTEVAELATFLAQETISVEVTPASLLSSSNHHHDVRQAFEQLCDQARDSTRRIIAALLPPQPRLNYVRDASLQISSWPRRYVAGDVHVSVQVERGRKDGLQLIGFVTRKEQALEALQGTPVHLLEPSGASYTQTIDDLGNFIFSALAPAAYTLELLFPDETVILEELTLTAQA